MHAKLTFRCRRQEDNLSMRAPEQASCLHRLSVAMATDRTCNTAFVRCTEPSSQSLAPKHAGSSAVSTCTPPSSLPGTGRP